MTILKKPSFFIITPVFLLCLSFSAIAHAATVSDAAINITADNSSASIGQSLWINVSMDTAGADANAVQAQLIFPSDVFKLENITDGSSTVSLWIDPPKESSPGVIDLAGIMPGGFAGNGPLFSAELQVIGTGVANIQVASATVLANDGAGTPLAVDLGSATIEVVAMSGASSTPLSPPVTDDTAPNPFTPEITSDPNIFDGKYFLVFSTTDSGSGVDHYEVLEVPSGASIQPYSSWHTTASPYLLTDQDLSSDIYVRAVDHDGNFIVVKLPAQHPYAQRDRNAWWLIVVLAILLVLLLFIWKARRRRHS